MRKTLDNIKAHDKLLASFGLAVIVLQLIGVLVIVTQPNFELSAPISQSMGSESDIRILTIVVMSVIGVLYTSFSLLLDKYWRFASITIGVGMVCMIIGSTIPYIPGENITGTHSMFTFSSSFLFVYTIYAISRKNLGNFSSLSKAVWVFVLVMVATIALMAGRYNPINFIAETMSLLALQAWTIVAIHHTVPDYLPKPIGRFIAKLA